MFRVIWSERTNVLQPYVDARARPLRSTVCLKRVLFLIVYVCYARFVMIWKETDKNEGRCVIMQTTTYCEWRDARAKENRDDP